MTIDYPHDWTPQTITDTVEAWQRIAVADGTRLQSEAYLYWGGSTGYGKYPTARDLTTEHVTALVLTNGEGTDDHPAVTVTLVAYSDYGGSDLDAANVRTLAGTPGVIVSLDDNSHGDSSATMIMGEHPGDDADPTVGIGWLRLVADMVEGLTEYPLLNDEDHSEYVAEVAAAAWGQYLGRDTMGDVEERLVALGFPADAAYEAADQADDDAAREAYYRHTEEARHDGSEGWEMEGATSVTNHAHKGAVDAIIDALWPVLGPVAA